MKAAAHESSTAGRRQDNGRWQAIEPKARQAAEGKQQGLKRQAAQAVTAARQAKAAERQSGRRQAGKTSGFVMLFPHN